MYTTPKFFRGSSTIFIYLVFRIDINNTFIMAVKKHGKVEIRYLPQGENGDQIF